MLTEKEMEQKITLENNFLLSVSEFKQWMGLLVKSCNGHPPGVEDWKTIKTMMDKMVDLPGYDPKTNPCEWIWHEPMFPPSFPPMDSPSYPPYQVGDFPFGTQWGGTSDKIYLYPTISDNSNANCYPNPNNWSITNTTDASWKVTEQEQPLDMTMYYDMMDHISYTINEQILREILGDNVNDDEEEDHF